MMREDPIDVTGCGYPGKGDMRREGDRGPCIAGYSAVVTTHPVGLDLITEDRLCPACEGEWLDREPNSGSRFITPPELSAEKRQP